MVALWHGWIDEAMAYASSLKKVGGYCVNEDVAEDRWRLSAKYLRGDGIEVGGLCNPLPVPEGATVRYVDRQPKEELQWEGTKNKRCFRWSSAAHPTLNPRLKAPPPAPLQHPIEPESSPDGRATRVRATVLVADLDSTAATAGLPGRTQGRDA